MKTVILILLTLVCFTSFSQTAHKRATMALIDFNSKDDAFKSLINSLVNEGFILKTIDKDAGVITTEPKSSIRHKSRYNVIISDEGVARLNGLMSIGTITIYSVSDESWSIIMNRGMKGSPLRNAWIELEQIANNSGGTVSFK